jgi:hypothetical protein
MDLHPDLQRFRLAQGVLRAEETTDRLSRASATSSSRLHALVERSNAVQRGRVPAMEQVPTFFMGEDRVLVETAPYVDKPLSALMNGSSRSGGGGVLGMFGWKDGEGNDNFPTVIALNAGIANKYKQQLTHAPEIQPYMGELLERPDDMVELRRLVEVQNAQALGPNLEERYGIRLRPPPPVDAAERPANGLGDVAEAAAVGDAVGQEMGVRGIVPVPEAGDPALAGAQIVNPAAAMDAADAEIQGRAAVQRQIEQERKEEEPPIDPPGLEEINEADELGNQPVQGGMVRDPARAIQEQGRLADIQREEDEPDIPVDEGGDFGPLGLNPFNALVVPPAPDRVRPVRDGRAIQRQRAINQQELEDEIADERAPPAAAALPGLGLVRQGVQGLVRGATNVADIPGGMLRSLLRAPGQVAGQLGQILAAPFNAAGRLYQGANAYERYAAEEKEDDGWRQGPNLGRNGQAPLRALERLGVDEIGRPDEVDDAADPANVAPAAIAVRAPPANQPARAPPARQPPRAVPADRLLRAPGYDYQPFYRQPYAHPLQPPPPPPPAPRAAPPPPPNPVGQMDPRLEAMREEVERRAELDVAIGPSMREADAARAEAARLRAAQREAQEARDQIVARERDVADRRRAEDQRAAELRRRDEEIAAAERDAAAQQRAAAPRAPAQPPAIAMLPPPPAGNPNPNPPAAAGLPVWRNLPNAGAGQGTAARQAVIDAQRPHFQAAGIDINATPDLTTDQIIDELFRVHPGGRVGGYTRAQVEEARDLGFKRSGPGKNATKAIERATSHLPRYARAVERLRMFGEGRPMTGSGVAPHLVKGSEAAKEHMANLRKMRGQKRGLSG